MKPFSELRPIIAEKLRLQDQAAEDLRKKIYELRMDALGSFLLFTFIWWAFYYLGRFPLWSLAFPLALGPILSFLKYKRAIYVPITQNKTIRQSRLNKILVFLRLAKKQAETTVQYTPAAWKAYLAALGLSKKYKETDIEPIVKKAIVQKFMDTLSDSISYHPSSLIDFDTFQESKIFIDVPDHYSGDDLIEGTIDGIPIKISELQVKSQISPKKWRDMFNGIFMVATYPRPFKTSLVLIANDLQEKFGYAARAASENNPLRMNFIASKDPNFNKLFSCYAQDVKLGEELLEAIMPTVLAFYKRTKLRCSISLIGDKIYAAIDYKKPLFVFNLEQPIWSHFNLKTAYKDFAGIYFLIETLDIDRLILPVAPEPKPEEEEWEEEEVFSSDEESEVAPAIWKFWKWQIWPRIFLQVKSKTERIKATARKQPPSNRWEYLKKLESRRDTDGDGKEGWS